MALNDVVDDIEQRCTPLGLLGLRIFDDPIDRKQVREDALLAGAAHPDIAAAAVKAELLARGWSSIDALTIARWYESGQIRVQGPGWIGVAVTGAREQDTTASLS
jgi:hypothetical protein